jgi:aldehyde:ferredoxin oxidoreductase
MIYRCVIVFVPYIYNVEFRNRFQQRKVITVLKGYTGTIVRVNLTAGKIDYQRIDETSVRKYIGGVGFAVKILWEETDSTTRPLSPENPLIFMTGPLTGTAVPSSSRHIVAGISPLTGIWGQSHAGGSWADELRHAGFDGVVVTGESSHPVYLWLKDGRAEIRDAGHLWGKDTFETAERVARETDEKVSTACIGRAGERLVKLAGIMSDGQNGRAAARCGLGALMGAKKLKAIAVKGTLPLAFHDEAGFKEGVRKLRESAVPRKPDESLEDDVLFFKKYFEAGRIPVKNWSVGTYEPGLVYPESLRESKPMLCVHCPYGCCESYRVSSGERHMVWEAWGPLGTNCLIADVEAMQKAYNLCNRFGIDTISTGAVIAFAMECYEKGLISASDTDGIELTWGNKEAVVELVRKIGEREGFGELLGDGVKRASEHIGGLAVEYAMQVKGLEFPAHDPRSTSGFALEYATGCIGASHMEATGVRQIENAYERPNPRTSPELGFPEALKRFDAEGKGRLVAKGQDFGCLLDSLTVCLFLSLDRWVQPSSYVRLINSATSWDMDLAEFLTIGERISNLKRMFNVRRGISRKDDTLPPRILTQKLSGGTRGHLPHLGLMLNEYYAARGWSEEGIPTGETLTRLGLGECLGKAVA